MHSMLTSVATAVDSSGTMGLTGSGYCHCSDNLLYPNTSHYKRYMNNYVHYIHKHAALFKIVRSKLQSNKISVKEQRSTSKA